MNWKNLWNKNYALVVFYALVLALLYHLGVRILDHFPELGAHLQNLFPWASQVISPLFLGFAIAYLLSPICHFFERILSKNALLSKKQSLYQNISICLWKHINKFCSKKPRYIPLSISQSEPHLSTEKVHLFYSPLILYCSQHKSQILRGAFYI